MFLYRDNNEKSINTFYFVKFQSVADRFYLNGKIKINRRDVHTLKLMNVNVIQKAKEHDYSFVCRLVEAVFSQDELAKSTASNPILKRTAYARLDDTKYNFIEGIFLDFSKLICLILILTNDY